MEWALGVEDGAEHVLGPAAALLFAFIIAWTQSTPFDIFDAAHLKALGVPDLIDLSAMRPEIAVFESVMLSAIGALLAVVLAHILAVAARPCLLRRKLGPAAATPADAARSVEGEPGERAESVAVPLQLLLALTSVVCLVCGPPLFLSFRHWATLPYDPNGPFYQSDRATLADVNAVLGWVALGAMESYFAQQKLLVAIALPHAVIAAGIGLLWVDWHSIRSRSALTVKRAARIRRLGLSAALSDEVRAHGRFGCRPSGSGPRRPPSTRRVTTRCWRRRLWKDSWDPYRLRPRARAPLCLARRPTAPRPRARAWLCLCARRWSWRMRGCA